ncbi:MAG: DUF305 domain-containing protein [Acidimicrobiales bacterium]
MDDAPLPWWRSRLNVALAAALLVLAGFALGTLIPRGDDPTVHNAVDVGFLQDMRIHHEQAVTMAITYRSLASTGTDLDNLLQTIALEIQTHQSTEAGRMVQLLRLFGAPETNETTQVMGWMGHPMPMDSMPGLATDAQLDALYRARGAEADRLFATLMIAHHEGGIDMARFAAGNARNEEVRDLARAMVKAQTGEVAELRASLGG